MNIDSYVEAVLFLEGEPMKIKKLSNILNKPEKEIREALEILKRKLEDRGIRLLEKDSEVMLSTAPEAAKICEEISKEEFNKEIGRAGLEVLAIVAYQGPISRPEIDYIRGVNSSFTLRNLLVRGLVERKTNPKDNRSFIYNPSLQLLRFLGVDDINKLSQYEHFQKIIKQFTDAGREFVEPEEPKQRAEPSAAEF